MTQELKIIIWPDPRLKRVSAAVPQITPEIRSLATRMLELMREARGVGLAAPQVGVNLRLFVMNPTGEPGDDRIYVNPELSDPAGEETSEEGCLSLPGVNVQVSRSRSMRIKALDLDGMPIDQTESGYVARIWQHEHDHLNGVLITDRMGLGDRFRYRKTLRELEEQYAAEHPAPATKPPARRPRRAKA